MEAVYEWLKTWFADHGAAREEIEPGDNYFDKGYVDSLGLIVLVTEIEEHFGISFSNDQFTDKSFAVIEGLVRAIAKGAASGRGAEVHEVE